MWDRATGQPIYNAIVWQDRRTAGHLRSAARRGSSIAMIRRKTGLVVDAYFSGDQAAVDPART